MSTLVNTLAETKTILRFATRADVPVILSLIRGLAAYEKLSHEVVATERGLENTLFGTKSYAEVILAEEEGEAVGFCLFFHNYSTFLGKPGIYIEDIFVKPEHRGKGLGKKFFAELGVLAKERDCGRIDWWVLNWNKPAIDFYEKLGANSMDEWTVYRLTDDKF